MGRNNLVWVMFLLLLPLAQGQLSDITFYGENLTYEDTFGTNTSSFIWMNETAPLGVAKNITIADPETIHSDADNNLSHYVVSGTGSVTVHSSSECLFGNDCILMEGTGGGPVEEPTITHSVVDVDLSNSIVPHFNFSYIDGDLEVAETIELYFFNGATYDLVLSIDGLNNALTLAAINITDWVSVDIPIDAQYQHASFRWFIRVLASSSSTDDFVLIDGPVIHETGNKSFSFPPFMRSVVNSVRVDTLNISLYVASTGNVSYTSRFVHHGTTTTVLDTESSVDGIQNFQHELDVLFLLFEPGDTVEHYVFGELEVDEEITFSFEGSEAPYAISTGEFVSVVNFTNYSFDNASFHPQINISIQSINPIISLRLERDGVDLGNMAFCSPDIYCKLDTSFPITHAQVNYTFIAEDVFGLNHTYTTSQNNTLSDRVLIIPNFNGEFYAPINTSTPFVLSVLDIANNIVHDASLTLFFPSLNEGFNLTYNPSTQKYDASLLFELPGDYIFETQLNTPNYELAENITGEVLVREETQVCIEVYTDSNTSQPYENNLATVLAFPDELIQEKNLPFLEQLSLWTDGDVGYFNVNALHAPYQNGQSCMKVYEVNTGYQVYLLQGVMSFRDNYDPPNIHEVTGVSLDLGNITFQQDSTYKMYVPRAELAYGKIATNLWTLVIFATFIGFAIVIGIISESILGAFMSFIGFFLLWLFVEIFIWVFT